jgi:predicted polyphosphate/ATP-dependent NAD kinase
VVPLFEQRDSLNSKYVIIHLYPDIVIKRSFEDEEVQLAAVRCLQKRNVKVVIGIGGNGTFGGIRALGMLCCVVLCCVVFCV